MRLLGEIGIVAALVGKLGKLAQRGAREQVGRNEEREDAGIVRSRSG
jgi:hypothetical protein